jgi:hypothetical protein
MCVFHMNGIAVDSFLNFVAALQRGPSLKVPVADLVAAYRLSLPAAERQKIKRSHVVNALAEAGYQIGTANNRQHVIGIAFESDHLAVDNEGKIVKVVA